MLCQLEYESGCNKWNNKAGVNKNLNKRLLKQKGFCAKGGSKTAPPRTVWFWFLEMQSGQGQHSVDKIKILIFSCFRYLKEFRVEQCPLFLQHKCQQHRPFTCFNWHFQNQKRRRPLLRRDQQFNYSADIYCEKYDETTGLCPNGDEWVENNFSANILWDQIFFRRDECCDCVRDMC